jgi:hypothetical protein
MDRPLSSRRRRRRGAPAPLTPKRRALLGFVPLDDRAHSGGPHLASDGTICGVLAWRNERWVFPGTAGRPADFEPIEFVP